MIVIVPCLDVDFDVKVTWPVASVFPLAVPVTSPLHCALTVAFATGPPDRLVTLITALADLF